MPETAQNTILIVDDEPSILEVASTFFQTRGYDVLTATNGKEALDVLATQEVDCCFTDINMPEMDGLTLTEQIRTHYNTLPVIVMTGYPSLNNTIHTLKNGVADFLVKPVNLSQMEMCVQRVLRERKLFIENLMLSKELEGKQKLEQLNTELRQKVDDLNILNKILNDFNSLRESNDVFSQLVATAAQVARADVSCFYLLPEASGNPLLIAKAGVQPDPAAEQTDKYAPHPPAQVCRLIEEVAGDNRPLLLVDNTNGHRRLPSEIVSYMLLPFKVREKTFGFLSAALMQNGSRRFNEKDLYFLDLMTKKAEAAIENLALYENIYSNLLATLFGFVRAIEARDPYTKQHSNRVTHIAKAIARHMDCTIEEQEILHTAGLLHDIGKIGIRDDILLKPGRLNDEEYRIIQQHPVIGSEIIGRMGLWSREREIVHSHHERYDGKGYPDKLAGDEIPLLARILSVADVYDAVSSDRAYRKRMEEEQILDIMYSGAGSQFDPEIVAVFRELYESGTIRETIRDVD